jgi:hypothetical protein
MQNQLFGGLFLPGGCVSRVDQAFKIRSSVTVIGGNQRLVKF